MTHRQLKFGLSKRSLKAKQVEKEDESGSAYWRADQLSSDNVDRLAFARARLVNHVVNKSGEHYGTQEFASYFRASTGYVDPSYSVTSHTSRTPIPKAQKVVRAYPSVIQGSQWSMHGRQASQQDSLTDFTRNQKYKCTCTDCKSLECPGRNKNDFKPRRIRDNIMTFSDQYTMTCKVNDASCGCTPSPSIRDWSVVSDPVRDHNGKLQVYEVYSKVGSSSPAPILKKNCIHTACQDEQYDNEPPKSVSVKCFMKKSQEETLFKRKNLYNEGISDVDITFPSSSNIMVRALPTTISKAIMSDDGRSGSDVNIPHSHRSESKYHKHCLGMGIPSRHDYNATVVLNHQRPATGPRITHCKVCAAKPYKESNQLQHSIRLPKKVLMSEKVIDVEYTPKIKTKYKNTKKKK